ncbi:hypothetical protein A2U20_05815 [Glaesserella parasuis D74]|nr:hypothetical protein A2U20_05815 [Glaesserella parasuis D74]
MWENHVEPLNLEKALQGAPVLLRNGNKAYIKFLMPKEYKGSSSLAGYVIDNECSEQVYTLSWHLNGKATKEESNHHLDIIGMYKESEPETNKVTLTLPCPLKKPRDDMWFISLWKEVSKSSYNKNTPLKEFEKNIYFGSEADAQAWLDAMENNRK